jgi:alpha-L-fucosidase 2
VDPEFRREVESARAKLPPFQIGRHGQLQEWLEDFEEAAPNHRHMSHLIALYPENQISPFTTPDLARAAEVTIERRIQSPNWEDTEWSWANLINFYARLGNGDAAYHNLRGRRRKGWAFGKS